MGLLSHRDLQARPNSAVVYVRHRPETTLFYQVVQEYWPEFQAELASQGKNLPAYITQEFEAYLKCGRLENMLSAITPEMFSTDSALRNAADGVPFREAYRMAMQQMDETAQPDVQESLARRISPGACGDLQLDRIRLRLEDEYGPVKPGSGSRT